MITNLIISALAVGITSWLLPGVTCDPWWSAIVVAIVFGLINCFIKPVVKLLSLPVNILTLGLFSLVINALMILLAAHFVDAFTVDGFFTALIFSIVLSVVNSVLKLVLKDD